jgi:hypothetical protein
MSPDPSPPGEFGRSPAQAVRAALVLAALGGGAVVAVERFLTRPGTPLGEAFARTGVPPAVPLIAGVAIVVVFAGMGLRQSHRSITRFRMSEVGLEVTDNLGAYILEWTNIAGAEVTRAGLGVRVVDREAVLRTHRGTGRQREWLRTMEPYGEWDFLFPQAELGHSPEAVLSWLQPHLVR